MSTKRILMALVALVLLLPPSRALAADIDAETLAKRVGQVFAGYNDFWVWVTQRFRDPSGNEKEYRGRAWFKRDKMFRLNFGQPPFLIHGTDGDEYWIYDAQTKLIEFTDLDKGAPVHPLLQVFAAGDQMVRALDRYFNIDDFKEGTYGKDEIPAFKLVLSLKPERLKELAEQAGNKLTDPNAKQVWTFWVDKKTYLPRLIQVDWETGDRYIFELEKFFNNVGLDPLIFRRPAPEGVKVRQMEKKP